MNTSAALFTSFTSLAIIFGLTACGSGDQGRDGGDELVRPVIYHEVAPASGEFTRTFPARVAAADMRELNFPVGGMVLPVPVNESDAVREGQLLAQLDARDYESALSAARARVDNAAQELDRAKRLFEQDAISKSVLEQREAAAEITRAEYEAVRKALADTRIEAPFDGIVSRIFVSESQTVMPGTPAVRVFSKEALEATIAIPASLIVNADGSRKEQGRALVALDADPDRPIEAIFKKADLEADEGSQSYAVTFGFAAPENFNVLPGMNAAVTLTLHGRNAPTSGVVVPIRAIAARSEARFVWVVDTGTEPHRVERRAVTVGPAVGAVLPVLSGLEPGETVVAAGLSELVEGMAVRPWSRDAN